MQVLTAAAVDGAVFVDGFDRQCPFEGLSCVFPQNHSGPGLGSQGLQSAFFKDSVTKARASGRAAPPW